MRLLENGIFNIKEDPKEQHPIEDRKSDIYKKLFKGMMGHIRQTGMIPWQNEKYK